MAKLSDIIKKDKLIKWLPTKNKVIDLFLGKGCPMGRVVELFGRESTGKTAIALSIAGYLQKVYGANLYFVDAESATETDRISNLVVPEKTEYICENELGKMFDGLSKYINEYKEKEPLVIVLDSFNYLELDSESKIQIKGYDKDNMERIKTIGRLMRRLTPLLNEKKILFIGTNHALKSLDPFKPEDYTPGGGFLKFALSVQIEVRKGSKKTMLYDDEDRKKPIGILSHLICRKSRVAPRERREIHIPLYFDKRGIDSLGCVYETLRGADYITGTEKVRKIEIKEGEEVKFKKEQFPELYKKYQKEIDKMLEEWIC